MKKMSLAILASTMMILTGCGDTVSERAATGGVGGAVVAGPVGIVAGSVAGAVTAD